MSETIKLQTPLAPKDVANLRVGQDVLLTGALFTARDAAHRYLVEREDSDEMPFDLAGGVLYHCGAIFRNLPGGWEVVSAGPTTSMRMEMYEPRVIERYGLSAIIGKGGMGPATRNALRETGGVYLAAPSGAGALLAERIIAVRDVWKLEEFGSPEAIWHFDVADFPAIVAMDSLGGDLYAEVEKASADVLKTLLADESRK